MFPIHWQQTFWKRNKEIDLRIASKTKSLETNFTKKVKDLYSETYKTSTKEIKDTNKWKDVLCSWIRRINFVKIAILSKSTYRFNVIPIKIPMTFFYRSRKNTSKIHVEPQKALNSPRNSDKEEQSQGNHTSWFQATL